MTKEPTRLVDDPSSPPELREALELTAETPGYGYDVNQGMARFRAGLIAAPADGTSPSGPEGAPNLAASASQAGGLAGVSALWWGLAAVGAAGIVLGAYYVSGTDSAETGGQPVQAAHPASELEERDAVRPGSEARAIERPAAFLGEPGSGQAPALETDEAAVGAHPATGETARVAAPVSPHTAHSNAQGHETATDAVLLREIAQLAETRGALSSNPARALALAREGQQEFRHGIFTEERAAISIFALEALGQHPQAIREAGRFLGRYPNGPFSARVRRVVPSQ